jgi:hypothetical protein
VNTVAARDISEWVPITWDSEVISIAEQPSAIIAAALRRRPMTSKQHNIPRYLSADVGGGSTLTEDTNDGDTIPLYGYQFNGKFTFDEFDSDAAPADEMAAALYTWTNRTNIAYDNASIGVTAARSATATDKKPFNSIYYAVTNADSDAGYSANANLNEAATVTYAELSTTLGLVENTEFWNPATGCALINPWYREKVRGIVSETTGLPIFVESTSGAPGGGVSPQYNLFGYPAYFTHGAKTSANFTHGLGAVGADGEGGTRRPLLAFVNREHLVYGPQIEPEARPIPASLNASALENVIQCRARRGFALAVPQAAGVMVYTG